MEFYKKHRPGKWASVIGQASVIKSFQNMKKKGNIPHAILLSGPSGCGKTTIARILRKTLKCNKHDYIEKNCADFRGIDTAREILARLSTAPMNGESRIWCIDEAHKLTADAQNAFLKALEDTPDHVYFILCTTEPTKLITTIRTRCTEFKLKALSSTHITEVVKDIAMKEEIKKIFPAVLDKIVEYSEGSARKALVLFNRIQYCSSKEEQLEALESSTDQESCFAIAQALFKRGVKWPVMAALLKEHQDVDPETVRYMILGYARTMLLANRNPNFALCVISNFEDDFYTSKKAGLAAACYRVIAGD
jgi:DNA polymerase III subunit gamma/tau